MSVRVLADTKPWLNSTLDLGAVTGGWGGAVEGWVILLVP